MKLNKLSKYLESAPVQTRLAHLYGSTDCAAQTLRWQSLVNTATATLENRDAFLFSAPGRSELGGNHTDHQRGNVLAAAVNLDTIVVVIARSDKRVRLWADGYEPFDIDLSSTVALPSEHATSAALIRGVADFFRRDGKNIGGFEAVVQSTVLRGSGLSSSAAFEVLIGQILNGLYNRGTVDPVFIARAGQYSENNFFGKPCGLMDQAASSLGGLVGIDFRDPDHPQIRTADFNIAQAGLVLAVVNTGGNHADLTNDYAAIPAEMRAVAVALGGKELRDIDPAVLQARTGDLRKSVGDRAILRALHFVADNERAVQQFDAVSKGDIAGFLKLVRASGLSSVNRLQNINASAGNGFEEGIALGLAVTEDFLGTDGAFRVHGGGFAGTIQAWVPETRFDAYRTRMEEVFGPNSVSRLRIRPEGVIQL